MKRAARLLTPLFSLLLMSVTRLLAQGPALTPGDSLVMGSIPPVPAYLADTAGRYGSYRSATLLDWNPSEREMLISTRFGDVPQLHLVKDPGAARQQLTFFQDAVTVGASPRKTMITPCL